MQQRLGRFQPRQMAEFTIILITTFLSFAITVCLNVDLAMESGAQGLIIKH